METKPLTTLDDFDDKVYGEGCLAASAWTNTFSGYTFGKYPDNPYEEDTSENKSWDDGFWESLETWGWM